MLDGVFHADVAGAAGEQDIALSWPELLAIFGEKAPGPARVAEPSAGDTAEFEALTAETLGTRVLGRAEVASLLTLDTESQASIVSCVARARERGRGLRDVMSTEMWEALNTFHLGLAGRDLSAALVSGPYSVYQDVKERCALFWGLVERTMLRDEGHSFLEAGTQIESADMVLRMLRVSVPPEPTESGSEGEALALLHAVGGVQAYRRAVREAPMVGAVARFLLYDSAYPGSVASSVESLHLALSHADVLPRSSPPVLRLGRLIADLELQRRAPDAASVFEETLERVQEDLELVDGDIEERYFAMAAAAAVHL
jgi:uncharacterized alpha-E superfamily protein